MQTEFKLKNIKPACIQDLLVEERKRSDGLTRENEKLKGRISQLEKELKKITQSQPSRSNQYHHPVKCDHADATMHQQPYYHPHTTTATTNAPTPIGTAILPHNTPTQLLQQPMLPPRSNQYHHPVNFDQVDASKHQQPYYHPHTTTATTNATTRIGTTILPHNTPTQLLQQPMLLPRTNQYHDPVKFDQADEHQQPYSISLLLRRSRAAYMRSRARAGRSLANTRRKRSCRGKHATKISIT